MKNSKSQLPWMFSTIFLLLIIGVTVLMSNARSKRQHDDDLRTLSQQWQLGHDQALGKPADADWFTDKGVYYVHWSHSDPSNTSTNYVCVLEFMGTNPVVEAPVKLGDARFFIVTSRLEKGCLYTVTRKRNGTVRFDVIKKKKVSVR